MKDWFKSRKMKAKVSTTFNRLTKLQLMNQWDLFLWCMMNVGDMYKFAYDFLTTQSMKQWRTTKSNSAIIEWRKLSGNGGMVRDSERNTCESWADNLDREDQVLPILSIEAENDRHARQWDQLNGESRICHVSGEWREETVMAPQQWIFLLLLSFSEINHGALKEVEGWKIHTFQWPHDVEYQACFRTRTSLWR